MTSPESHPPQQVPNPPQQFANPYPFGSQTPRFAAAPSSGMDFTTPVELRCILTPTTEMKRMIGFFIFVFLFAGLVIAVIAGIIIDVMAVWLPVGVVGGAAVSGLIYLRVRSRLTRTYGQLQTLRLSPYGLQRTDGTIVNEMPWATIDRIQVTNSALPSGRADLARSGVAGGAANAAIGSAQYKVAAGIVGQSTMTPLPGAVRGQLKAHDRVSGGRSNLRGGQPYTAQQGVIFPGEFEEDWMHGTVGAWLRHYRPDVQLPQ